VLVPSRSRIQALLLRLYNVGNKLSPSTDDARTAVFQMLLGTTFSLWRSVFLLDKERTPESMHAAAIAFLERLIEDNTILYGDDRKTGAWTGGYYLANACMRLRELESRLKDASLPTPSSIEKVSSYLAKSYQERLASDSSLVWNDAYEAANAVCESLESPSRGA